MAAVMVAALAASLAMAALALRGGSGLLAAAWQSQSREARQVAEAGLTEIIAELNKPSNRRMLVSGRGLGAWATTPDASQENPCLQSTAQVATTSLARSYGGNSVRSLDGDSSRTFVLRSVRYLNSNRDRWLESRYDDAGNLRSSSSATAYDNRSNQLVNLTASTPPAIGYLQLGVEGRLLRSGGQVAKALITREYQVLPKCCGRSFYGPSGIHGVDARSCNADNDGSLAKGKLGLVFGFNGGGISTTGTSGQLLAPDNTRLQAVLCVTTTGSCSSSPSSLTTPLGVVPVLPISLVIPPAPSPPAALTTSAGLTLNGNQVRVLRLNQAATAVELCTASSVTASTVTGCSTQSYCLVTTNSTADAHCRLQRINLSGSSRLIIDSSRGRVAFYLNDNIGTSPGTVAVGGSAGLLHRSCLPPGSSPPTASQNCLVDASLDAFDRLAFYGNQTYNNLDLQGSANNLSLFVYFPRGLVSLGGGASLKGSIWTSSLATNGGFTIQAPPTNCQVNTQGFCSLTTGGGGGTLLFDWVARGATQTRLY